MIRVRVAPDAGFKKCCMQSGEYDGSDRHYYYRSQECLSWVGLAQRGAPTTSFTPQPNESLQQTGADGHHYESALTIATLQRIPHIEMPPAAEL